MKSNDTSNDASSIDDAILSGVLGLSVMFLSLKDEFITENKTNFLLLIFSYLVASMIRIFGIILDSKWLKDKSVQYCKYLLIPFTCWAVIAIILVQLKVYDFFSQLPSLFFSLAFLLILRREGELEINISFINKDKLKEKQS